MQVKLSKTLEGIIARTAFTTTKRGIRHALKDHLMLELLAEEGALAYQLLSERMEAWALYQLRLRIEQGIRQITANSPTNDTDGDPETFFRRFSNELCAKYALAHRISTAHALLAIAADEQTASSKALQRYRMTLPILSEALAAAHSEELRPQVEVRLLDLPSEPASEPVSKLIDRFGSDLTRAAREGRIDPVVGRDREIEELIRILSRRKKNNPVLIGEAGVGKTAVVEGLALRMAAGNVPASLRQKRLFALDISALVAGTKFRGEFEERMQQLLGELKRAQDTILFIDEIHTMMGAGSTQGSLDTANILKPALARGELQTIGATTLDEYREYIERDTALVRRFRQVLVEPTGSEQTRCILQQVAPHYEQHHGVRYTEEAISACVELTGRYQTDRHFPDKAIDLLDEAGATARMEQQESPSIPIVITRERVERVITAITGIPIERIAGSEQERLRGLQRHLAERVIGQEEAVTRIARTIQRARAGLKSPDRPIGVFLFVGPTGVGKTLLAKELSKWLFDEDRGLIRLDMSEYTEKHNVARLIGSPPGYVGYGEGGQLTEAVRRRPYAVVLFDEIEKAHPDIFHTLLQLFDEGHLTDGSGRRVDFRNTVVVMTSNVGSREVAERGVQVGYTTDSQRKRAEPATASTYRKALERTFAPELLNRIDEVVLFRSLNPADVEQIVGLELAALTVRTEALGYTLRITPKAQRRLAMMGYEARYGARALKRTLVDRVEEPIAQLIIEGRVTHGDTIVVEGDRKTGIRLRVA